VVEVRIEGRRLDVFEGFDFSFNYGVADIRNPEKRSTEYSKTIKCPATKSNDALFGHIYDVNISNNYNANTSNIDVNFNPNKKAEARVIADGVEVMAGVVQLRKVMQKGHAYTYEVVFVGKLLNIFSKIGDKQIIAFAGFTYTSSFLSGAVFSRLITGDIKESTLSDAQVDLRKAMVNIGGSYDLLSTSETTLGNGGYTHRFDYGSIVYDAGNNFVPADEIYLSNYQTIATASSVVNYTVTRTKRTFYSITGIDNQRRWWRYDILFTGLCNVYERINGVWTLYSSNQSTNQTLYDLTGDIDCGNEGVSYICF
jgi:hypothetical protein